MLTLFTMPKPFRGHSGIIQRNAIQSWLQLRPACEIILCGDDEGTADVAAEFGTRHVPEINRNEFGSPLLNSLFEKVQAVSRYDALAYVNADIILMSDFVETIKGIPKDVPFLILGQRWDLDITEPLDFSELEREPRLRRAIVERGVLHSHMGVDYYIFPKMLWVEIPPFAIGRTVYDNWLIYRARLSGARVIDATKLITCVHQNHERTYASVGLQGPMGETEFQEGKEARRNLKMAGGPSYLFTLKDANWVINANGLVRCPLTLERFSRHIETLPVLYPYLGPLLWPIKMWLLSRRITVGGIRRVQRLLASYSLSEK